MFSTDPSQLLAQFRGVHSPKRITNDGVDWSYSACGRGESGLLLLPGYLVGAESWFQIIGLLEDEFRIVAPHYAPVSSVTELFGLLTILDREGLDRVHLVGQSIGGQYARELRTAGLTASGPSRCHTHPFPNRTMPIVSSEACVSRQTRTAMGPSPAVEAARSGRAK